MAPRVQLVSLDDVERALDALVRQPPLPPRGRAFLLGQALAHCGQSVRCSLTGYPKMRSALFRATLGRIGLLIHATAGFVDPGWTGKLTLELSNVAKMPIALYFGMKIGQLSFMRMSTPVDRPYGSPGLRSKYQGQMSPTPSRAFTEYSNGK